MPRRPAPVPAHRPPGTRRPVDRGARPLACLAALWLAAAALPAAPLPAAAEAPLSAIDWLSESIRTPPLVAPPVPEAEFRQTEPGGLPPLSGLLHEEITAAPLGRVTLDAVGLLPPRVSGFPADLWAASRSEDVVALIHRQRAETLPEATALLRRLLVAELDPPGRGEGGMELFLARLDKLLEMGALEEVQALIERAGSLEPEVFRRWFDVSLLLGLEDRACTALTASPDLAPSLPARIFCLARAGDWPAAALTLATGEALGFIDTEEGDLLARFLDPELFEEVEDDPAPSARVTPLELRMRLAVGLGVPAGSLPLAFAHADLAATAGWRAQLDAAERLARAGAVPPGLLFALYSERLPAASGGVWDRVAAVQALDIALLARDLPAIVRHLPRARGAMAEAGLEPVIAAWFGDRLAGLPLAQTPARGDALRLRLLSEGYEAAARELEPADSREAFLRAIALGRIGGGAGGDGGAAPSPRPPAAAGALGAAVEAGLSAPLQPGRIADLLEARRPGEALLEALLLISDGARADPQAVETALAALRRMGLEAETRRIALQLMLLAEGRT